MEPPLTTSRKGDISLAQGPENTEGAEEPTIQALEGRETRQSRKLIKPSILHLCVWWDLEALVHWEMFEKNKMLIEKNLCITQLT